MSTFTVSIGTGADPLTPDTPIDVVITAFPALKMAASAAVVVSGGLTGWAAVNLQRFEARAVVPPATEFQLFLASGQQHHSRVRLRDLFYSDQSGSTFPDRTWRQFERGLDVVNHELELFISVEYTDRGNVVRSTSNVLRRRYTKVDLGSHDATLTALEGLDYLVEDLAQRVSAVESRLP